MIFVVDLDGTLVKNDLFMELLIGKFFTNPKSCICSYLTHGPLGLKRFIFKNHEFSDHQILINSNVLNLVKQKKSLGYTVVLATASLQVYANYIAEKLQIFDEVFGSTDNCNLKGNEKLKLILSIADGHNFEYVGDSKIDNVIFKQCVRYYKVVNYEVYEFTN